MIENKLEFKQIDPALAPLPLLLEADPSQACIERYLFDACCFVAYEDQQIVAVCIAKLDKQGEAEIFNIAVLPNKQGMGIGSQLLKFTLAQLKAKSVNTVLLGTGTFGYQLTFYQRLGFRVESVRKDFFLTHYNAPIFEDGIQHKDMLRLKLTLNDGVS